jgi:hypothetical protein
MTVFVSYSSRDRDAVNGLVQDLQDADEQVWMDQRLAGGEAWWRAILDQIRGCDVFIFALSQNSLDSKPCQAELQYAKALELPILPVQVGPVDSMQLNPLATVQAIDYRDQKRNAGMRLIAALHRERARRQPLPESLPDEPPVPFEYLIRLYTTIAGADQLSPRDQAALVAQLQVGLREDGQHEAARKDIVMLLNKLHDREDVTYQTRTQVESILTGIEPEPHPEPADTPAPTTTDEETKTSAASGRTDNAKAPESGPLTPTDDRRIIPASADAAPAVPFLQRLTRRRTILMAVPAAIAVIIAVVAVVLSTGNRSSSHAGIAASSTTTTTAPLTDAQSRLLALVPSYKCSPRESSVGIASVSCNPGTTELDSLDFTLFADQPSLDRAMAAPPPMPTYSGAKPYGGFQNCPGQAQAGPQDWNRVTDPQHSAGKVACYLEPDPTVRWSVESQLLLGEVYKVEFGTLNTVYQWWVAGNQ